MVAKLNPSKAVLAPRSVDADTFTGLRTNADGSAPIARHVPPSAGSSYDKKRKISRENEKKAEYDMRRKVCSFVKSALSNQVRLQFRVREFVKLREQGKVPERGGSPIASLAGERRHLRATNGPALVVDLDDVPVFWYFPNLVGTGLRELLLRVAELTTGYRPKPDDEVNDRRAQSNRIGLEPDGCESDGPAGRTRSSKQAFTDDRVRRAQAAAADSQEVVPGVVGSERQGQLSYHSPRTNQGRNFSRREQVGYGESSGETRRAVSVGDASVLELPGVFNPASGLDFLSRLGPCAYYLSPGWFQTGMEKRRPLAMSSHFQKCLEPTCLAKTIRFLEAKRLYDRMLGCLVDMINPSLSESMLELRASMSAVTGPTNVALENGWTSAFPCFGVGINRTSTLHRDSKGIRAGMDMIGVLGTFTTGGELNLFDLNLDVEWTPGCLGAFDGYDFRHQVRPWAGGSRVALISFCRRSTWAGLGLEPKIIRPTISDVHKALEKAEEARRQAGLSLLESQKQVQAIERQAKMQRKAERSADQVADLEIAHQRPWSDSMKNTPNADQPILACQVSEQVRELKRINRRPDGPHESLLNKRLRHGS